MWFPNRIHSSLYTRWLINKVKSIGLPCFIFISFFDVFSQFVVIGCLRSRPNHTHMRKESPPKKETTLIYPPFQKIPLVLTKKDEDESGPFGRVIITRKASFNVLFVKLKLRTKQFSVISLIPYRLFNKNASFNNNNNNNSSNILSPFL